MKINHLSRSWRAALASVFAASAALSFGAPASAAAGDGVDFNNKNTLVQFHTKDCRAEGTFNYLNMENDFSTGNKKTAGPAWCRVGIRIMYKKASTGAKLDTGVQWSASNVAWNDRGVRCFIQFSIQRPADGNYVVTFTNRGAGGAGCGIDGY